MGVKVCILHEKELLENSTWPPYFEVPPSRQSSQIITMNWQDLLRLDHYVAHVQNFLEETRKKSCFLPPGFGTPNCRGSLCDFQFQVSTFPPQVRSGFLRKLSVPSPASLQSRA